MDSDQTFRNLEIFLKHDGSSFMLLPTDIHVQLLSYLNYRDLQMLRATHPYFRALFSDIEIDRTRHAYVKALQRKEEQEVRLYGSVFHPDDDRLTCYSCLRCLQPSSFADTQTTGRRRKGHTDAWKRFCTECAIRGNKWEPGILLEFNQQPMVYCRRCRKIKSPVHENLKPFGLCLDCCAEIGVSRFQTAFYLDWYEVKMFIDQFFAQYHNSRTVIPEADWLKLENELSHFEVSVHGIDS